MNEIVRYFTGPAIGALIGCFTNYLAVKMLFRPYKEVKILGFRMPFTPGIIPKRQNDISRAVGTAVGNTLFTGEDLKKIILSDSVRKKASDMVFRELGLQEGMDVTEIPALSGIAEKILWDDRIENLKTRLSVSLADMLISAVNQNDVEEMIIEKGTAAVQERKSSMGLFGLLIKDASVRPLIEKIYAEMTESLNRDGRETLVPIIKKRLDLLVEKPMNEIIGEGTARKLRISFDKIYTDTMSELIVRFREEIDIEGVVEDKVRAMDIAELEKLCLSVMRKELNSIVWLGAVLGFLIGILNMFLL